MTRDQSYGIVPLRKISSGWETLLVCHHKGFWGFPKGHSEHQETEKEAAERELFEETGLKVVHYLSEEKLLEHYHFQFQNRHIDKTVTYFIAEVIGDIKIQNSELADARWISLNRATELLSYPESQQIALQAERLLSEK